MLTLIRLGLRPVSKEMEPNNLKRILSILGLLIALSIAFLAG